MRAKRLNREASGGQMQAHKALNWQFSFFGLSGTFDVNRFDFILLVPQLNVQLLRLSFRKEERRALKRRLSAVVDVHDMHAGAVAGGSSFTFHAGEKLLR